MINIINILIQIVINYILHHRMKNSYLAIIFVKLKFIVITKI